MLHAKGRCICEQADATAFFVDTRFFANYNKIKALSEGDVPMAVPKFDKFLPCILKVLEDGKPYRLKDVAAKCADALEISDEDRKMLLPSKRQTVSVISRISYHGEHEQYGSYDSSAKSRIQ